MIIPRAWFALAIIACTPAAAHSQAYSAAFGGWVTTGAHSGDNAPAGFRLSGAMDHALAGAARWQLEGAFVQAGFTRDFPSKPDRHVTENSLEVGLHLFSRPMGSTAVRVFVGPVVSLTILCGTDGENDPNGRIACADFGLGGNSEMRLGGAAGARGEWGHAHQFTIDVRAQANTIASARGRGPAIIVAAGLRLPQ